MISGEPHAEGTNLQRATVTKVQVAADDVAAWFLNLRDEPQVEVSVRGGPRTPMRASVATADQRARMWPQIAARYRNYAGYQRRTQREIPLALLRPTA